MGAADNIALLEKANQASAARDWEGFADTHTDDVVVFSNGLLRAQGREELIKYWHRWFTPFPDLRLKPLDVMVDDDRLFLDAEMTGTHTGPFEIPGGKTLGPTGRSFSTLVVLHFRMRGGKMAQVKEFINIQEILRQLGLATEGQA